MKPSARYLLLGLGGVIVAVAVVLLWLLAIASANTEFFERYYALLYRVNLAVGVLLSVIVSIFFIILFNRLRKGKFGTRLMAKLGIFFAIVGVLPGLLIYLVSLQFVSRSIESWFDVKVETALEAGLNLGRAIIDNARTDLEQKARVMADQLSLNHTSRSDTATALLLSRLQSQFGVQEATLLNGHNQVLASASDNYDVLPKLPSRAILRQAHQTRGYTVVETLGNAAQEPTGFQVRVIVPLTAPVITKMERLQAPETNIYYLQLVQHLSAPLSTNASAVEQAYAEYQAKAIGRVGLRKMYIGTLTLTLLLVVFIAMSLALLLGQQLVRPLLQLLQGTKAVAQGDLSPYLAFSGNDELSLLTQQFNQMTKQLAEARNAVNVNRQALEQSKAYLESILMHLTAGVLVMDYRFILTTANPGAERIFQLNLATFIGKPLDHITLLRKFNTTLHSAFVEQENTGATHWQKQIEVPQSGEKETLILLVRGTRLPANNPNKRGFLVVFDDITEFLSAQRALAWGEVARRLAHEIKNPLTPIQLSAERLQMKLFDKLPEKEAKMLERSITTIVTQVGAMQRMVDDFRDYARLPQAVLQNIQLNELIIEVLALYGIDDIQQTTHNLIKLDLADNLPEIQGDPSQLRQVIHNLIQNALDAVEGEGTQACVMLSTDAVKYQPRAVESVVQSVRLTVADNGPGFSAHILSRAFEPYMTTKAKGTGLGLAVVKKIVEEHGARIDLRNNSAVMSNALTRGASVTITFVKLAKKSVVELPEKP